MWAPKCCQQNIYFIKNTKSGINRIMFLCTISSLNNSQFSFSIFIEILFQRYNFFTFLFSNSQMCFQFTIFITPVFLLLRKSFFCAFHNILQVRYKPKRDLDWWSRKQIINQIPKIKWFNVCSISDK